MQDTRCFVRVPVSGACTLTDGTDAAALLQTDVTERYLFSVQPEQFAGQVLCYLIDARGGERGLPVNLCGTCLYHTGCPIYGDLLIGRCTDDPQDETVTGFTPEEAAQIAAWMHAQFPSYLDT